MLAQRIKHYSFKWNHLKQGFDRHAEVIGYMASTVIDDHVYIGVSLCNPKDKFDIQTGRDLAVTKTTDLKGYKLINRHVRNYVREDVFVSDIVTEFMERCSAYYKDKYIVAPRIEFV